ncbi:uncharacterized protein Fot_30331 [Forsythia ovata]|uniref:Uncharacterized protein n=1 Tax=Forsythia ovata TaxID=205694 RepID=A0ABD1TUF6_9LAMI
MKEKMKVIGIDESGGYGEEDAEEDKEKKGLRMWAQNPSLCQTIISPKKKQSKKSSPLLSDFSKILCEKQQSDGVFKKPVIVFNNDEVSEEFSEICSTFSKSVSSTFCYRKERDNENVNEVRQSAPARFKNWSFSDEVKKEKTVEKTLGRRFDLSPGWARSGSVTGRNGPTVHGRRDSGEGSCWRSMSPVTHTHGGPAKAGNALEVIFIQNE